ncbi:MAG: AAA family ATPase [Chromatiales bacterium]|nr:AAA family ATPase [Chromatiales bacterium]
MLNNPLIKTLLLFVGAWFLLTLLKGLWPPLLWIAVILSTALAATLWILEYQRDLAFRLYMDNPVIGPFIEGVCKLTGRQVPIQGGQSEPVPPAAQTTADLQDQRLAPPTKLTNDQDFIGASQYLKKEVRGCDDVIDSLLDGLRNAIRLRGRVGRDLTLPPLASFLLAGREGLGKRYLAERVAAMLYDQGPVTEIDLRDRYDHLQELVSAAKRQPNQTLVIENIDAADERFIDKLANLLAGQELMDAESGTPVSFRNTVIFLVSHRPADGFENVTNSQRTMMAGMVSETLGLPPVLVNYLHGYYGFTLPAMMEQAQVVTLLIERECAKYDLTVQRIDAEILAREVKAISDHGAFDIAPGRIAQRLKSVISDAIGDQTHSVSVTQDNYGR